MASIIDTYLHDLQQSLQVGPRQKARILCEVKDIQSATTGGK